MWLLNATEGVKVTGRTGYVIGAVQGFPAKLLRDLHHAGTAAPQALGFVIVNLLCAALFGRAVVMFDNWPALPMATVGVTPLAFSVSFVLYRWFEFRSKRKA